MTNRKDWAVGRRSAVGGVAVSVLLAGLLVAGCGSGEDQPQAASIGAGGPLGRPGEDREYQVERYRDCLLQHGVTLLDHPTAEGMPQVDKQRTPVEVVSVAYERCRLLLPTAGEVVKVAPEEIEARRRLAVCVREQGVPEYPDPDPVTGDPRVSDELAIRLKGDPRLAAAVQECRRQAGVGTGPGVVGG
ncbi:MAG TPA: hypothetical protein VFM55_03690 [Micromonosporaceae bacterium]|nr:hypothetical protein [Micromonosporaceae bacterium]